ncbi:MAG: FIG01124720: hypothetical protein, partial [uncultured Rubrobacteraceae bacterium]
VQPLRSAQRAQQGELRPRLRPSGPQGVLRSFRLPGLSGARARPAPLPDPAAGARNKRPRWRPRPLLLLRRERRAARPRPHPRRPLRPLRLPRACGPPDRRPSGVGPRVLRRTQERRTFRHPRRGLGGQRRPLRARGRPARGGLRRELRDDRPFGSLPEGRRGRRARHRYRRRGLRLGAHLRPRPEVRRGGKARRGGPLGRHPAGPAGGLRTALRAVLRLRPRHGEALRAHLPPTPLRRRRRARPRPAGAGEDGRGPDGQGGRGLVPRGPLPLPAGRGGLEGVGGRVVRRVRRPGLL